MMLTKTSHPYGLPLEALPNPFRFVPLLFLVLSITGCRTGLTPLPSQEIRTYASLLQWATDNGTPGSVLIVKTPITNVAAAVGIAVRHKKVPMQTNSSFRIASIAKSFVGIVAAQAVAEGKLDLDKPITQYLPPDVTNHIPNCERITTRHLLRHTSGVYDFERSFAHTLRRYLTDRRGKWTPERDLNYAYDKPSDFAPGSAWRYSTSGYILVGMILDRIYGRDHSLEIRARILTPLGLSSTFCELTEPARGSVARGYENWWGLWSTDVTDWAPMTGAMVSTAPELATFIRAIVRNDEFLDPETRSVLWGNRDKGELRYDFGISLSRPNENAPWFFGHTGAAAGYLSFAYHEPKDDITIVYLANTSHMRAQGLGRRRQEFTDKLSIALFELSLKHGGLTIDQ
jgi:D-alanyl-D-alanine carboxypeptidase